MLLTDSNSRGSRIAKNVLNVVIICAVFVTAVHFKNSVASDDNDWATQQIETMQGIRQTAQDSVAFAQGMENPDEYAAQIENVQQYITDYEQPRQADQDAARCSGQDHGGRFHPAWRPMAVAGG